MSDKDKVMLVLYGYKPFNPTINPKDGITKEFTLAVKCRRFSRGVPSETINGMILVMKAIGMDHKLEADGIAGPRLTAAENKFLQTFAPNLNFE